MTYEETEEFLLDNGFILKYNTHHSTTFCYTYEDESYLFVVVAKLTNFDTFAEYYDAAGDLISEKYFGTIDASHSIEEVNDALIKYLMEG